MVTGITSMQMAGCRPAESTLKITGTILAAVAQHIVAAGTGLTETAIISMTTEASQEIQRLMAAM